MYLVKLGLIAAIVSLSGCEAKNLYVAHDTVIGINAKLSDTRQQGRLVIGYDRDFVTIIPKSVQGDEKGEKDAMASLGCNRVKLKGTQLIQYSDFVATGPAAIQLARKLNDTTTVFDCKVTDAPAPKGDGL
jgi:hypothetical protein